MSGRRRVTVRSREEMIGEWRLVRHLEPLRSDAVVERSDGLDLDRLVEEEIEEWYERMLHELPMEDLPQQEAKDEAVMTIEADGSGRIVLPDDTVRVASVKIEGWSREATIVEDPDSGIARDQGNRYTRGGRINPVAVVGRDGVMRVYTPPGVGSRIERLMVVKGHRAGEPYLLTGAMRIL